MIRVLLYDPDSGETQWGGEELIDSWSPGGTSWIWADFNDEDKDREAEIFSGRFGLHRLVITDSHNERHPPKVEGFDGYYFLLVHGLDAETVDIDFGIILLAFFVGENFIVTRRFGESPSTDRVWDLARAGDLHLERGPVHIEYKIVRRMTDRYTELLSDLDRQFLELERQMFEEPRTELLEEILTFSGNLKKLRRIFTYHQGMFNRLRRQTESPIDRRARHEFTDIFEQTEQLESLSTLYKELADDLVSGHISLSTHKLNEIMKVLTVVTVVFLPLSLLAGIYGMNFEQMPELKMHRAYFVLLGVMATIAASLLYLFRKMKWL